jgi:branched-chain amino acid transport system ATP-binding protein
MTAAAATPQVTQQLALEVDGACVYYGSSQAIFDLTLQVANQSIIVVVGLNGAGKTTLLSTLVGLLPMARGSLRVFGQEIQRTAPQQLHRRGVVLIPEGRGIFPQLTVKQNLQLGAYRRYARRETVKEYDEVLERFPLLRKRLAEPAGLLSGGQQQILAIGRALMASPRVLLLDEPLLGLDPINRDRIFTIVEELNEQGVSILMASQVTLAAFSRADRTVEMRNGRIES